jgi:hypothetical protein
LTSQPNIQEEKLSQSHRALIGWVNEQEGIQFLLNRTLLPTDDLPTLQQTVVECQAAVGLRQVFTPKNPIVDVGDDPLVKAVKTRPEIQAAFNEFDWYPALVDLREVLAFQKLINMEGLDIRLALARDSREVLFELCLPSTQSLPPSAVMLDQDGKAVTISSLNPNLRVSGFQAGTVQTDPNLPSTQVMALTFLVSMGTSYLQVVQYRNRYFIRDGYHRAAGLLRENINIVPCIVINAQNFDQVGANLQQFIPYEVLFGERPPRLVDFWDEDVSRTVQRTAVRKVVRVRADEFVVQG